MKANIQSWSCWKHVIVPDFELRSGGPCAFAGGSHTRDRPGPAQGCCGCRTLAPPNIFPFYFAEELLTSSTLTRQAVPKPLRPSWWTMEAGKKRKAANAPETPTSDGASAPKKIKLLVRPLRSRVVSNIV